MTVQRRAPEGPGVVFFGAGCYNEKKIEKGNAMRGFLSVGGGRRQNRFSAPGCGREGVFFWRRCLRHQAGAGSRPGPGRGDPAQGGIRMVRRAAAHSR